MIWLYLLRILLLSASLLARAGTDRALVWLLFDCPRGQAGLFQLLNAD